jgi:hypothetical protein
MERPISTRPEPLTYSVETAAAILGIEHNLRATPIVGWTAWQEPDTTR